MLAGVAATDVICCIALGKRSASSDHKKAVALLSETPGMGSGCRISLTYVAICQVQGSIRQSQSNHLRNEADPQVYEVAASNR